MGVREAGTHHTGDPSGVSEQVVGWRRLAGVRAGLGQERGAVGTESREAGD